MTDPMPLVIAEAGVNHNGDLGRARDMVAAAAEAGADYVKFQAFSADGLVAGDAETAAYQATNTGVTKQADLLAALEIDLDGMAVLAAMCGDHGIRFLCTPFDVAGATDLVALGMDRLKVASGELTNVEALRAFAAFGLPVILSTGMTTLDEVGAALAVLDDAGARDVTLLHCTSLYPAPPETLNLRAMATMAERFARPVGYSDHSLDDYASIAAVALGACIIEKHFTLDRSLPGPDHQASLEPDALAAMITRLRQTEQSLGDGEKRPAPGEAETAALVRRSWHAARDLAAGAVVDGSDAVLMRPADGLDPASSPVGRTLAQALAQGAPIRAGDLT
jgi:N-acetylneuraminate synthase/N,N'-diacetyllegionaminate synthase